MGNNLSYFKGDNLPVENVSWNEVQEFLKKLNARNDGYRYRLPTEAEWEYAARAGTAGDTGNLNAEAWYSANSGIKTHPVGEKQASAWGLYDMKGNVGEWVQDWEGDYPTGAQTDPQGPDSGITKIVRGGSWGRSLDGTLPSASYSDHFTPSYRNSDTGFRLLREPIPSAAKIDAEKKITAEEFVAIRPGTFMMGDTTQHQVTITKGFEMGKYEVTQAQWQALMGNNPSYFKGDNLPVENVSWNDTQEFLKKLNARNDGYRYRLPTEAEWEYAARAGTTGDSGNLNAVARSSANSGIKTHPVVERQPNAWGLYDMVGNVSEWVQDWSGVYPTTAQTDPQGPDNGTAKMVRGGSLWSSGDNAFSFLPTYRNVEQGFRLLREAIP